MPAAHAAERDGPSLPIALVWVLLGAVLIAASVFILTGGSADPGATATATATEPASPEPSPATEEDPAAVDELAGSDAGSGSADVGPEEDPDDAEARAADVSAAAAEAEARAALAALPETTTCANLFVDAQVFHEYASAHDAGRWADPSTARLPVVTLDELAEACDRDYARRLGRYVAADPSADEALAQAIAVHLDLLPQVAPPPADAAGIEAFHAGDVRCTVTHDGVGCSATPAGSSSGDGPAVCADGTGRVSVAVFGGAVVECPGTIDGGSTELTVGESTVVGPHACSVEAREDVLCWNTATGEGFRISPARVEHVALG